MSRTLSREDDALQRPDEREVMELVIVLECDRPAAGSAVHVIDGLARIELGRAATTRTVKRTRDALVLGIPDDRMSSTHARITRQDGGWQIEDAGSKNGVRIDGELRAVGRLDVGELVELGHTLVCLRRAVAPAALDVDASELAGPLRTFVPKLARKFTDVAAIARSRAPVLILGETGTGKEVAARAVHALSGRSGAFVAVNCGALPETLVESELFGSKRGAFSGADQDRKGLVRAAERGTLFLDEIADLPLGSQAALLRVLQEREVTPVGGTEPIAVDVQFVAATLHDLPARVARDEFRRDLYARLAAFVLPLPVLRERREDLGLLIGELLARIAPAARLTCTAARLLLEHDWPLNIRELESCLTVACALAGSEHYIRALHVADALGPAVSPLPPQLSAADEHEREELVALLRTHAGNVSAIARVTGKQRAQIHRWLRRFQLDADDYR